MPKKYSKLLPLNKSSKNRTVKKEISNWNLYPKVDAEEKYIYSSSDILNSQNPFISTLRGNGRSYGDASLGEKTINTTTYNKILKFDSQTGAFTAQSGILLADILRVIIPKGWFLPVTPGTKFITLGGAVSSDVHGKNHHSEGGFSKHIISLSIMDETRHKMYCGPTENVNLFKSICGGMGLVAAILEVSIQLKPIETSFIKQKQIKASNLEALLPLFEQNTHYTYSVAWIDCLKKGKHYGRSILMLGEHAKKDEINRKDKLSLVVSKKINIPFSFPSFSLNKLTIGLFNWLYYNKNLRKEQNSITNYDSFFYPLDNLLNWNRIYGKKGFIQYQFVIPKDDGGKGIIHILKLISNKGMTSFLAVLKTMGKEDLGYISFPKEGYTLALDFPIKKGLFEFLDELDQEILKLGGRLYLAKDARMDKATFHQTYEGISDFQATSKITNKNQTFNSDLNTRLAILPEK
ncbi:MAG: decaprenylphospho-beta-D-ribofuranose 2-oxidase [Sediminicola sp.]|jgi:decaprenylphospho-beta-D-ribofuranose 2-oxidase